MASIWKRVIDVLAATAGLIILGPVLAGIAILVRRRHGAPVLFRQSRSGFQSKPFRLLKFRTMIDSWDNQGSLAPDDDRLTPLGRTLRRWSVDELPELLNVVKGDMSLVGPRPLLMEYLPLYSDEQARRHEMRPGLTGLAQVSGRNDLSWEDRLALDVWYVDNWSLWLDFKIITRTVGKVFFGDGVSAEGHATMPRFEGSNDE